MPDLGTLALFIGASIVFLVIPGPSVLYIVTQSVTGGRRAGLASMLGVQTGALVHVLAAAAGLSAILARSAPAYDVVRYAGAAYLIHLGVRKLVTRLPDSDGDEPGTGRARPEELFRRGIVVNVLNPKTALFFLAFLPQFADPEGSALALQVGVLGLVFVVLALLSDGLYAVLAASVASRLRESARVRERLERTSSGVYIGLGALAALGGDRAKP